MICFGALDTTTKIASTAAPVPMAVWVIRPDEDIFHWLLLLPLLLVAANTGFQVLTSRMARTEDPGAMHFYTGLVGLVLTTLGHFMLIMAHTRTPVAVLTPCLCLQIGLAALGGGLVFAHVPDAWSQAGIALVAVSGVFGTWLTGREVLARGRQNEAQSSTAAVASADAY